MGCEVIVTGVSAESDIEGQITLLQNAVSAKVDAIVIGPVDSTSLAGPVKEATSQVFRWCLLILLLTVKITAQHC